MLYSVKPIHFVLSAKSLIEISYTVLLTVKNQRALLGGSVLLHHYATLASNTRKPQELPKWLRLVMTPVYSGIFNEVCKASTVKLWHLSQWMVMEGIWCSVHCIDGPAAACLCLKF